VQFLPKIEETIINLRKIASKLEKQTKLSQEEQISLLGELRENTVSLNLLKDYNKLDQRTVAVLYLSRNIITDFWANLGGDAAFGFEMILDEATKFSKQFGNFLSLSLSEDAKKDEEIVKALFESIALYYSCLSHMAEKSEEVYHKKKVK
jgi:hypothetical protein